VFGEENIMPVKWKKTKFKGVRYYEHDTRKHGLKKDRYFAIRYQNDGQRREEGIGWSSERDPSDKKYWTEEKAFTVLQLLKKSAHMGEGPARLSEKRKIERQRKESEKAKEERDKKDSLSFKEFFENDYCSLVILNRKKKNCDHDKAHFSLWIEPVIGNKALKDISSFDVERIKKRILDAKRSPRTCQHVLATVRQVWNTARRAGLVSNESPTRSVKIPKFDNRRQRFLSYAEADLLLQKLRGKDINAYRMSLLSLHTGMRASKIFKLTWGCVDPEHGTITILDGKSGKSRTAYMTKQIKDMFSEMKRGKSNDNVFLQAKGIPYKEMTAIFRDSVDSLKLNEDISDPRQKVCFHTLRHTFASWHVEGGTDLYVLKELLGHGSIQLTERYSHLSNGTLQQATKKFSSDFGIAQGNLEKRSRGRDGS
jgi:integrase